jgi:hypothetical protein
MLHHWSFRVIGAAPLRFGGKDPSTESIEGILEPALHLQSLFGFRVAKGLLRLV